MATVGDQLTAPEPGWKRYDDKDPVFKYIGTWNNDDNYLHYANTSRYSNQAGAKISFIFKGTKLRVIGPKSTNKHANVPIIIDGQTETFSQIGYNQTQILLYEKTGLSNTEHSVEIIVPSDIGANNVQIDAIDIDDTGRLLHPDEVTDIKDLDIGKRIRCNYNVISQNTVGLLGRLGEETGDFIPASSSNTPKGDFYFICVDRDSLGRWKLIADRNIQHAISWDTLNSEGIASGSGVEIDPYLYSDVPIFSSDTAVANGYTYRITRSSADSSSYEAYKAFNGSNTSSSDCWLFTGKSGWIQIDMGRPVSISRYSLWGRVGRPGDSPKNWTLQASNTGDFAGEQVILHNASIENSYEGRKTFLINPNKEAFRYYRIVVTDNFGGINTGIGELLFEQKVESTYVDKTRYTIRLLTGGVSSTDKDNEWDKYIVNSTLNGTITAGDNNVWNWSGIRSWTSTTVSTTDSSRATRGNNNVSYFLPTGTSNIPLGFRPVLLIEFLPSIKFEGSLDKTTIHNENVILSGTITEDENLDVQYRILVNGVQVYPETGFTALAPPPISISYTIPNSRFVLGYNRITIEMVNSKGDVGTWVTSVTLDSQAPAITASMTGNRLDVSIGDPESDSVRFRVLLNGTQVHPDDQTKEFTDLAPPTVTFSKLFRSNEVNVGSDNTVTIIAQDQFGKESTVTLNFIGEYAGLMFADEAGEFYSDDLGNVLQYLDVGILVAGQISETYPVRLINKTGFTVTNIQLWKDRKNLPPSAEVQISKTETPFVPVDLLEFDTPLQYNDEVTFYVRVVTQINGQPGQGDFDVFVKADPT